MVCEKGKNKKHGFTLIEAMIFLMLFSLIAVDAYRSFTWGAKVLVDAKARIAASQVANEKFETLRNVSYENLEVNAVNSEYVVRSGMNFNVQTEIVYVNDDFDNPGGLPDSDTRPNDYKKIEVGVSWTANDGATKTVNMTTYIAPPGTEELYNGGILNIEIRQSDGTPVQGALVDVRRADTNAEIYSGMTLSDGKIYLIGLTPGDKLYKISVSKNGYESVTTMPPYNQTAYDPVDEHGSVVLAGIWSQTIIFDPLSEVQFKTQDPLGNAVANIDFSLEGGRKLGDTMPTALPVYFYAKTNQQSDAGGEFLFTNKSPGKYIFGYPDPATINNEDYDFWKIEPSYGNSPATFFANPGTTENVTVFLLPKNMPALFLTVTDKNDNTPIAGAAVELKNDALSFDQTLQADQFGQVYFPKKEDPVVLIENAQYDVIVNADGYQSKQMSVAVSDLTKQDVQLEP